MMVASTASGNAEAQQTEPDENAYLVFAKGLTGGDASCGCRKHFLFQGTRAGSPGCITRINLDADAATA